MNSELTLLQRLAKLERLETILAQHREALDQLATNLRAEIAEIYGDVLDELQPALWEDQDVDTTIDGELQ